MTVKVLQSFSFSDNLLKIVSIPKQVDKETCSYWTRCFLGSGPIWDVFTTSTAPATAASSGTSSSSITSRAMATTALTAASDG